MSAEETEAAYHYDCAGGVVRKSVRVRVNVLPLFVSLYAALCLFFCFCVVVGSSSVKKRADEFATPDAADASAALISS